MMCMRKKLSAIGMNPPDIPTGFTECEYLESTGSQTILTNVPGGNDALRIVGKASIKAYADYSGIFGNFVNDGNRNSTRLITNEINAEKRLYGYINEKSADAMYAPKIDYTQPFEFDMSKTRLIINGKTYTPFQIVSGSPNNSNIRLFSMWAGGVQPYQRVTFYHFSAYDGQEKIIDLIPVLDASGKPCMFDLVSRQCFYNQNESGEDFYYKIKAAW